MIEIFERKAVFWHPPQITLSAELDPTHQLSNDNSQNHTLFE